jgi:ubiquinone/menaquinone biosynthesis C-methylase UbiE
MQELKPDRLIESILEYRKSKVLMVAAYLGCFDVLEKPKTAVQTAAALSVDPRATEILLDALVATDLLRKRSGAYRNSPLASRFLVSGKPAYLGDNLRYQELLWDAWGDLREIVRKGSTPRPLHHWLDNGAGFTDEYIRGMDNIARRPSSEIASAVKLDEPRRMLDVGAGPGTYSLAFLRRHPSLHATLLDLPGTLKLSKKLVSRYPKLSERIDYVAGDYSKTSYGKNRYDLVVLSHITHDEGPETNRKLIEKSFQALKPGGKILIHDFIVKNDRTAPVFGALFSVHMLVYTRSGRTYTSREYKHWIKDAGFKNTESRAIGVDAKNATNIFVAVKPKR